MQLIKSLSELVVVILVTGLILLTLLVAMPETAHASDGVDTADAVGILLLMLGFYFLPWIVAGARKAKGIGGIVVVNLFLGWTLLGWVGALAWAAAAEKQR